MKNSKYLFGLVIIIMMMGCAKTPIYKSTWQQPSSSENGNGEDWIEGMYYDSESGIMYGLTNNQENLYVKMKFTNNILQQKVVRTGLTFWIDTLGKKNKQLGLTFPVKSSAKIPAPDGRMARNQNSMRNPQRQIDTTIFNSKYREGMQTIQLVNYFGEGRVDLLYNKNEEGINAILRMDEENMLYYEAEISLQKIFPNPSIFLKDSTQYFSFGIETGKIEMPSNGNGSGRPQMNLSGGGRGSGGGGGQQGGGPKSGGGKQQMDPDKMAIMQAMSVESKVWVKKACLINVINDKVNRGN